MERNYVTVTLRICNCNTYPIHAICQARPDKTVLSVSCLTRRYEWIPEDARLSPTENLKSEHGNSNCPIYTATRDTTQDRLVESGGRCELSINKSLVAVGDVKADLLWICYAACYFAPKVYGGMPSSSVGKVLGHQWLSRWLKFRRSRFKSR